MSDHECFRCPECGSCPACAADALDNLIEEAERHRERLDQFEAYDITVASALADRDRARTLEHIGTGAGLAVRMAMPGVKP